LPETPTPSTADPPYSPCPPKNPLPLTPSPFGETTQLIGGNAYVKYGMSYHTPLRKRPPAPPSKRGSISTYGEALLNFGGGRKGNEDLNVKQLLYSEEKACSFLGRKKRLLNLEGKDNLPQLMERGALGSLPMGRRLPYFPKKKDNSRAKDGAKDPSVPRRGNPPSPIPRSPEGESLGQMKRILPISSGAFSRKA